MSVKLKHFYLCVSLTFSFLSLSLSNPDLAALLAFKSASDPSNSLSSWSNSSSDPCSWLGVACNPSTRRVTKLVLNALNLTGSVQPLTRLAHLRHLSLHHNRLSSATGSLAAWPNLKHLYLSHNLLADVFPDGISHLHRLRRLDLSYNRLTGEIPLSELAQLPHLVTLRLEFNSFTGNLDSSQMNTTSISDFNISGNDLAGKIPAWLSTFPATSFAGNEKLCGSPLLSHCPNDKKNTNRTAESDSVQIRASCKEKKGLSSRAVLTIVGIDAAAVLAALVTLTCCCCSRGCRNKEGNREAKKNDKFRSTSRVAVMRESEEYQMVFFEGCKGFTKVDELLKASAEMLGKGALGTTYKVALDGGDAVVVKRVRERRRKTKVVDGFLRVIGGLRHPNVVSLRAYSSSMDELLLVCDFLPNGSLHFLLHGNRGPGRTPLDWTTRLKMAAGSARGLAFLHSGNGGKLFHGHLTTSNIIVDCLGSACVSDAGLHHLFPIPPPSFPDDAYRAPELAHSAPAGGAHKAKFLQACDVYSFGAVLLEILTGKIAGGGGGGAGTGLAKWVELVVEEKGLWELLDFELLRYREMEEEMVALLQVALLCLAGSAKDRPKMERVEKMIENIMKKGGNGGNESPAVDLSSDSSSVSENIPNFASS